MTSWEDLIEPGSYRDVHDDEGEPEGEPTNVTPDGQAHHALLLPDGTERCRCGDPYPCPAAVRLELVAVEPPYEPF